MRKCLLLLTALFLASCGLDDYPFINPVPQSNITQQLNNRATVYIPNSNSETFTHFAVFYRIYVSNTLVASTVRDTYSTINPALASDANVIRPYIDSDTLVDTNMDSFFQGRGYRYLSLQSASSDTVLSSSVLGKNIVFDFSSSRNPTMIIDSDVYTLIRSNGNGLFSPRPTDRLFVNTEDLWKSEYINSTTNADVVDLSGIADSDRRYTYAAMYIVAVGINTATYSNIYSTPSLIHVFQLPDQW